MLWAFRDVGNDTQLLYKKTCWYGPMATYDTYNEPIQSRRPNLRDAPVSTSSAREGRKGQQAQNDVVWVLNRSPAMIACHNAQDGSVVGEVDVGSYRHELSINYICSSDISIINFVFKVLRNFRQVIDFLVSMQKLPI